MTSIPLSQDQRLPADWRDLFALTQPGVMRLVVYTGLCGLLAAPVAIHPLAAASKAAARSCHMGVSRPADVAPHHAAPAPGTVVG